jgi:hypothetical protein
MPPIETQLAALCISEAFLRTVAAEKRMSLIKAWEEKEKAKAENRQVILLSVSLSLSSISHFTHGAYSLCFLNRDAEATPHKIFAVSLNTC